MRKNLFRPMKPDEFLRAIENIARSHSCNDNFKTFCAAAYYALAKRATPNRQRAQALEERFFSLVDVYGEERPDCIERMGDLLERLKTTLYLTENDFLGLAYMESGLGNRGRGEAFSPTGVAQLLSRLIFPDTQRQDIAAVVATGEPFSVSDPACGSGVLTIQVAELLKYQGFELGRTLLAHMTDLNPVCFHMAFVQAELLGIPAVIERGDTLTLETFERAPTTKAMLEVYRRGMLQRRLDRTRAYEPRGSAAAPVDEGEAHPNPARPGASSPRSASSKRSLEGQQGDLFDEE